jgi:hypothetical protein
MEDIMGVKRIKYDAKAMEQLNDKRHISPAFQEKRYNQWQASS